MKTLKVYGTRPKGHGLPFISWLIRIIEWSDISHVALGLPDGRIYHAHFNEVKFEPLSSWVQTVEIVHEYTLSISEEMYSAMLNWCEEYKGKKQGYFLKLFGCFMPQFLKLFSINARNSFYKDMSKNALCSELIRFIAKKFWSYEVPEKPHAECFTTQDVIKMMTNNNASIG